MLRMGGFADVSSSAIWPLRARARSTSRYCCVGKGSSKSRQRGADKLGHADSPTWFRPFQASPGQLYIAVVRIQDLDWSVANDLPAVDKCLPQVALGVDGCAVGSTTGAGVDGGEGAAVGGPSGGLVVVIGPDFPGPSVTEITCAPIGAEAGAAGREPDSR